MKEKKVQVQLELDFSARDLAANVPARKKEKPCLNCGGKVLGWSIVKRICRQCKRDPEWRSAAKGLSDIYSITLKKH